MPPPWRPSWMLEWNQFSSSEFPSPQCLPPSFSSIRLTILEQMSLQDFQDGHHGGQLGYWNGTYLAILNLQITPMPPNKFQLNLTYSLGGDVVWRFSKWLTGLPSWLSEWNDFSNSKPPCDPMPFTKFWQADLGSGKQMWFQDFQDGHFGGHLDSRTKIV